MLKFLGVLLMTVTPLLGNAQSVPTNGLVAFYPFDGNANDVSGNAIHGTATGVTLTTDRFGRSNAAYQFSGNNSPLSYVRITNAATLQFPSDFTFSAWIRF